MTKTQNTVIALGLLLATTLGAQSAFAFGGGGGHFGEGKSFRGGDREGLVPTEMREEWRAEKKALFENLTEEEKEALRTEMKEKRQVHREEKRAAVSEFTGLSTELLREAKQSGKSMGDILTEQGISQTEAEQFLTEQAHAKVDSVVERHSLEVEEEQTLRNRIADFVQSILDKWFGATA